MTRIVDLSKPIRYNTGDPRFMRVKIKHKGHGAGKWIIRLLGLPFRLFPEGFTGWADDTITKMGVHSTTHIDAPWHFGPKTGDRPAKTIDLIPMEWCYGPGVVINMAHKADFDPITVDDLKKDLDESGAEIAPGTIVLIRTDRDRYMGTPDFMNRGTGMSAVATRWLIDRGVKVMGIDQWGWDLPLHWQIKKARRTGNRNLFWEAHRVGCEMEYLHIEQLTNLKSLPAHGFTVAVFPLKIVGGSAAPARVAAIFDEKGGD